MGMACSMNWAEEECIRTLLGKPEEKIDFEGF
jgi:hypothetical protein